MAIDVQANKDRFCEILRRTGRAGVETVLAELDQLGFFSAPASTRFHLAEEGGLCQHSLNVYDEAMLVKVLQCRLRPNLEPKLNDVSVAVAALLHDVCKAEVYKTEIKHRKVNGKWEDYLGYVPDYSALPLGHGEKSVIRLLRWGFELTDEEMMAIRWHMHAWSLSDSPEDGANFNKANERCPLLAVLIAADGLAAHILETH
ncbi:MAG: HD family phosphohydrolase [Kiritimatiellia bacterium]|nr:HD family phosphohydrolase [Kiritimatiellia bacterium]